MIGGIDLAELRQHDRVEASLRFLDGHARLEARHRREAGAQRERAQHVGEAVHVPRVRRHDADDRRDLGALRIVERLQTDRSADQLTGRGCTGDSTARRSGSPPARREANSPGSNARPTAGRMPNAEKYPGDTHAPCTDSVRSPPATVNASRSHETLSAKTLSATRQSTFSQRLLRRHVRERVARRRRPHLHQPIRVGIRERADEVRVDDAVRRGGERDRDAEREDGGERERRLPPHRADREQHVLPDVVQPESPAVLAHTLFVLRATEPSRIVDVAELRECDLACALGRVAERLELAGAHGEVEAELLVDVGRFGAREAEAEEAAVAFCGHGQAGSMHLVHGGHVLLPRRRLGAQRGAAGAA